jgi:SAM-dependent methyltransferase
MHPFEPVYIADRLADGVKCDDPVVEFGAGWDLEFHRKPLREAGLASFYAQDVTQRQDAALDFVGDLCQSTDVPDGFAGVSLAFNVLEHVPAPWLAVDEVFRATRTGGVFMGAIPLRTALHRWDGIAYLLRRWRLVHFAMDGNVAFPAALLFTAVKDPTSTDWWEHNQDVVLKPEVVLGFDYTVEGRFKRRVIDFMRRRSGRTIERWDGPWKESRMRDLGFTDWTVRSRDT